MMQVNKAQSRARTLASQAPSARALNVPRPLSAPLAADRQAGPGPSEEADRILGRRLRRIRVARGLTQRDVAAALGLSYKQIQNYEAGRSRVVVTTLVNFARIFRTSVTSLLRDLADEEDATAETAAGDELLLISDAELAHLSRLRAMPKALTLPIFRLTEILAQDEPGRDEAAAEEENPAKCRRGGDIGT